MYIRKVTKKTGNYQRDVYRLVESYRTESGPRQRTIITLKDFDLPEKDWKYLADTIEAKLRGQLTAHLDGDIDICSETYVSTVQEKRLTQQQNPQIIKEEAP